MDETEKAQWIAEVTFLKAYFHFNLVRKWDGPDCTREPPYRLLCR